MKFFKITATILILIFAIAIFMYIRVIVQEEFFIENITGENLDELKNQLIYLDNLPEGASVKKLLLQEPLTQMGNPILGSKLELTLCLPTKSAAEYLGTLHIPYVYLYEKDEMQLYALTVLFEPGEWDALGYSDLSHWVLAHGTSNKKSLYIAFWIALPIVLTAIWFPYKKWNRK